MNKRAKSNSIRLISGRWRGRRLPVLDSDGLRPTTDRVRETVFNWLMHDVTGAHCLDLFAGTGALGLECLSRGAASVDFVESNRRVYETLEQNLKTLGADDAARIVCNDALAFLNSGLARTYDLVFLDPPFESDLLSSVIQHLQKQRCLSETALIYIEQSSHGPLVDTPAGWSLHKEGKAGHSAYRVYAV